MGIIYLRENIYTQKSYLGYGTDLSNEKSLQYSQNK